jgi:uncharacterized membrane protein
MDKDYYRNREESYSNRFRPQAILPAPSILQAYEDIAEGSMERLLEMAEAEQIHRHEWENKALAAYVKAHRIGQISGLVIASTILSSTLYVATVLNDSRLAITIAVGGFLSLAISSVVASKSRRYERKPRRPYGRSFRRSRFDEEDGGSRRDSDEEHV